MRRSIDELRTFYGEPTGALARRLLARRLEDAWGEATNCDVLGLGYATPWLDAFVGARRLVAAMPGATAGPVGSAMPAVLAGLTASPAAASADTRGGASGGVHIDQVLIQVSIPAGADATRQGGLAGRAAADSFRARLFDGLI